MKPSTDRYLVIGFGNIDRADDGIACHVVNALRRYLGKKNLSENETGLEEIGSENIDSIFISQLTPELIDILSGYRRIVFVDAHVDPHLSDLHSQPVRPESAALTFSHHMTPAMLLAFGEALHHVAPDGYLVSIRGRDFDFHRELSPETQELIEPAVERVLRLCCGDE